MSRSEKQRRFFLIAALVAAAIGLVLFARWVIKRLRSSGGQGGITLIETVLAVTIIAIVGLGVLKALDTNARSVRVIDEQVQATNLLTAYLEGMRQLGYSDNSSPYNTAGAGISIPQQYSVVMNVAYSPNGTNWYSNNASGAYKLQKISISVLRTNGKQVLTACTFRAKR